MPSTGREEELLLKYSPYLRTEDSTSQIMSDVCISLIPATLFGIYVFGIDAFITIVISIVTCISCEFTFRMLLGRKNTIYDGSAVVTGLLLALTLPPGVPWWIPVVGGAFAIIVVKELYGGLGKNIMNPALAARCFLLLSYTGIMTEFTDPFVDEVSGATPLALMSVGKPVDIGDIFLGYIPGSIGEVSVVAILFGALYLAYRRIITATIPVAYITSFLGYIVLYSILYGQGAHFDIVVSMVEAHLFAGGLLFGAFFMATDYVTSPMSCTGQIIYGIVAGVLTGVLRTLGSGVEGVAYAILCSNMIVPLIDKVGDRQYGKKKD